MMRRLFSHGVAAMAALMCAAVLAQAAHTKPNVVFILADNVGYGDLGPYGGGELRGAPTPRIDQLAKEGLRLTQFLRQGPFRMQEAPRLGIEGRGAKDRALSGALPPRETARSVELARGSRARCYRALACAR